MIYEYQIEIDGRAAKTFTCKRPETAYTRFNREAAKRGYTASKYDPTSHGLMVWVKGESVLKLRYQGFRYN